MQMMCNWHREYADDVELLAKEKSVLQGTIERLVEMGRCYGMEMKVERNWDD